MKRRCRPFRNSERSMRDEVLGLLGLAAKAGRLGDGEAKAEEAMKSGKAALVLMAQDASERTKRTFLRYSEETGCPLVLHGTKESLGRATGKKDRAVIALLDRGLSEALLKKLPPKEVYGNED